MALRPPKGAIHPIELEPKTAAEVEEDKIYFGVEHNTKPAPNPGSKPGKGAKVGDSAGNRVSGGANVSGGTA